MTGNCATSMVLIRPDTRNRYIEGVTMNAMPGGANRVSRADLRSMPLIG